MEKEVLEKRCFELIKKLIEKSNNQELSSSEKGLFMESFLNLSKSDRFFLLREDVISDFIKTIDEEIVDNNFNIRDNFCFTVLQDEIKTKCKDIANPNFDTLFATIYRKDILLNDKEVLAALSKENQNIVIAKYNTLPYNERTIEKNTAVLETLPCKRLKEFVNCYPAEEKDESTMSFMERFRSRKIVDNNTRLKEMGFSFGKAVIYLKEETDLDEDRMVAVLNEAYKEEMSGWKEFSITDIYNGVIDNNFQKTVNLEELDTDFKAVLPDLLEDDFSKEQFSSLAMTILNVNQYNKVPIEYIKLFLVQLAKQIAKENNLPLHEVTFQLMKPGMRGEHSVKANISDITFNSIYLEQNKEALIQSIEDIFHEERHIKQRFTRDKLSISNLLYTIDEIYGESYYNSHYNDINKERDARRASKLETYAFLKQFNVGLSQEYLMMMKDNPTHFYTYDEDKNNLKKAIVPGEEENLIQSFVSKYSPDELKKHRQKYEILGYIMDENGRVYSQEELEAKMVTINKNDNHDEYFFYKNYLQLLKGNLQDDDIVSFTDSMSDDDLVKENIQEKQSLK